MSDLMREEFEETYKLEVIRQGKTFDSVVFTRESSGEYIVGLVQSAWWAWQAARECLVIELPDKVLFTGSGIAIESCRDAIHAAGVKTK